LLKGAQIIQRVAVVVASDLVVQFAVWPVAFDSPKMARAVGFDDGVRAIAGRF
jgi:hypothetical protein